MKKEMKEKSSYTGYHSSAWNWVAATLYQNKNIPLSPLPFWRLKQSLIYKMTLIESYSVLSVLNTWMRHTEHRVRVIQMLRGLTNASVH